MGAHKVHVMPDEAGVDGIPESTEGETGSQSSKLQTELLASARPSHWARWPELREGERAQRVRNRAAGRLVADELYVSHCWTDAATGDDVKRRAICELSRGRTVSTGQAPPTLTIPARIERSPTQIVTCTGTAQVPVLFT